MSRMFTVARLILGDQVHLARGAHLYRCSLLFDPWDVSPYSEWNCVGWGLRFCQHGQVGYGRARTPPSITSRPWPN